MSIEDFYANHESTRSQYRHGLAAETAGKAIMDALDGDMSPFVRFRTGHDIAARRNYNRADCSYWIQLLVDISAPDVDKDDIPMRGHVYAEALEDAPGKYIRYPHQKDVPSDERRELDDLQVVEALEAILRKVTEEAVRPFEILEPLAE